MNFNPFASIIKSAVDLRNWAYDRKIIQPIKLPIPVVSVGNITMGGTGKTPVIHWLLNELIKMKFNPGVVARNYGAIDPKEGFVFMHHEAASFYGDEAVMLKMNNPEISIYSGFQKWKSALKILENKKDITVLLVDDGYQHRRLSRDFDLLLLDTSVSIKDYSWPPFGRARESLNSIERASAIIFTKCESSQPETLTFLEKTCLQNRRKFDSKREGSRSIPILHSKQLQGSPQWVKGTPPSNQQQRLQGKGLAFCGLGNPESFLKGLKNQGLKIEEFKIYSDHFQYDNKTINSLISLAKNFDYLVTSEKDFVKLLEWPKEGPTLYIVPLEYHFTGDLEGFRERLLGCLWKNT